MTRKDQNPLRRPRDRAATVIGLWLLVACAAAAPFIASAAKTVPRAFGAVMALAFLALIALVAIRHVVNRKNLAAWDAGMGSHRAHLEPPQKDRGKP